MSEAQTMVEMPTDPIKRQIFKLAQAVDFRAVRKQEVDEYQKRLQDSVSQFEAANQVISTLVSTIQDFGLDAEAELKAFREEMLAKNEPSTQEGDPGLEEAIPEPERDWFESGQGEDSPEPPTKAPAKAPAKAKRAEI